MKIWESKPPGILWATPGLLRDCFTFTFLVDLESFTFTFTFLPFIYSVDKGLF
jgi:hypothetical protein